MKNLQTIEAALLETQDVMLYFQVDLFMANAEGDFYECDLALRVDDLSEGPLGSVRHCDRREDNPIEDDRQGARSRRAGRTVAAFAR